MKTNSSTNSNNRQNANVRNVTLLRKFGTGIAATAFSAMLLVGSSGSLKIAAQTQAGQNQTQITQNNLLSENRNAPLAARASYADIVEKVTPAVVTVRSEIRNAAPTQQSPLDNDMLRQFFGDKIPQLRQQKPQVERGLGSGVIVEANGTILTNNHVVEGATTVKVDLPDRRTFNARVVGTDSASDLAVLKIEASNLPTLALGDSDKVRVGDVVLAIGNPLGLRQTVTSGIISAKGRQTGISDGSFEDFLQTDAPINHGNSGGALVNLNGELVGINSQILSPSGGSIGLGFSIPSNMAKSVMSQLIAGGKVHRGMLGVGIQDVTSDLAGSFGLKDVRGVIVNSVSPNSPAEKAGVKQGDVIVSFNGTNLNDGNELRNRVAQTAPNTDTTLGIVRDGKAQTVKITLGEFQPKTTAAADEKTNPKADPAQDKLGLKFEPLTPQVAKQLDIADVPNNGLVVTDVQSGSPADEAGIQQGDVILQVNRQAVKSAEQIKAVTSAKTKGNSILFLVNRGGQNLFMTVQI